MKKDPFFLKKLIVIAIIVLTNFYFFVAIRNSLSL